MSPSQGRYRPGGSAMMTTVRGAGAAAVAAAALVLGPGRPLAAHQPETLANSITLE